MALYLRKYPPIPPTAIRKRGWKVGIIVSGEVKRERWVVVVVVGPKGFGHVEAVKWWRLVESTVRETLCSMFRVSCAGCRRKERDKAKNLV